MRPHRWQPTSLCRPWDGILQARTLEWVAIPFSNAWKWKVKMKLLRCVWLLATPWTATYQAPPSMGFSRQEYWSRVPFPSPEKSEHWRIDAFELWCWRRLLRVPWTARRSNQSILKEISLGCSLEGLMLKLKLQYFSHLMQRTDSLEKTLMLGKIDGRRRKGWDGWMISPTQWTWVWESYGCWRCTSKPGILHSIGSQRVGHTEWLNWTETLE